MAKLNNVPAYILPYKDRVCIFCEGGVTYGAYWDLGKGGICVGSCCKDRLIHMYKDIIFGIDSCIYVKEDIKNNIINAINLNYISKEQKKLIKTHISRDIDN